MRTQLGSLGILANSAAVHAVIRARARRMVAIGEFDFRYNARHLTDTERTNLALAKTEGKRLMYRDSR